MQVDIAIVGGGMTGISAGLGFADAGFKVIIIERNKPENICNAASDGRASAVSLGSKQILSKFGVWRDLDQFSCPIEDILITDGKSKLYLYFDGKLLEEKPLGLMLENNILLKSLYSQALEHPNLTIIPEDFFAKIEENQSSVTIHTNKNLVIEAKILIAADGKNSSIRKFLKIDTQDFTYNQTAIVCNIAHEKNHENIAQEKFYNNGPFAILPLKGGYSSSIVWTEKTDIANTLKTLSDEDFMSLLSEKFTDYLGGLKLISPRFYYELHAVHAKNYFKGRVVLIGDAAHFIHPIAGQGFNLALRDIEFLVDLMKKNSELGLDIASKTLLSTYEKTRSGDNKSMLMITDSLNRLFSNDLPVISSTRKIGLHIINEIPAMQKSFMKYAMGLRG